MIDLDHFKGINDRYGHLVGDDCLRFTAQRIGKVLRAHDALLARFGGEEFVVGLSNHDLHDAVEVAESLRRALVESPCGTRSEEHTSELQSLMRISYAVFCLKKKKKQQQRTT